MDTPDQKNASRNFWAGLLFWTVLCLVAVLVRGVRWEEGFERAQVIVGLTPYPDGHPHPRWYWNAYSIQYYCSAILLWITDSAAIVCGSRQFLSTLAIHLPVYVTAWLLSRRVAPAHIAVVLSMVGANTVFQSYMPIAPWATKATAGLLGMGWALAVVTSLAAGRWRLGGLLFGLMPIIHMGQWPMILVTSTAFSGWLLWKKEWAILRPLAIWAAVGLSLCVVFTIIYQGVTIPPPTEGAYYSAKDNYTLWAEYTTREDMHRARTDWPRFGRLGNSIMGFSAILLIGWPMAWREIRSPRAPWPWLLVYAYSVFCTAAMVIAWIVHQRMGSNIPFVVVSWMPYRLIIHLSMLLIGVVCALAILRKGRLTVAALAALGWLAALPLWPWLLPADLVERYFSDPQSALFLLFGAALPEIWTRLHDHRRQRIVWAALLLLGGIVLLTYHQMAAATILAGIIVGSVDIRTAMAGRIPHRMALGIATTLALVTLAHTYTALWHDRAHLPRTPFEVEVAAYLADHSPPEALVLTPLNEHYQMVLERGVMATFETRQFTSYMMSLASTNEKLFADLYGVRDGHWYDWDLWQARSEAEWQTLGDAYGFRFVLSKDFHLLHLPERLRGDGLILYEIPQSD